ncbi:MarR family transcriptional regulator [Lactococcus nasutitermitis]|uniref:MarR family transcriptional regulator n=1 Tax=Lactococcus nasutitermitis TaxID=1652957 RepID=A0ABV9JIT6_9LACT|nr:MarR family transcriptional regulator [Lactococcus nasutitermitis]
MNKQEERQGQLMSDLTDIFNKNNLLRKPLMEQEFRELSLSEIEALEVIDTLTAPNVTKLAEALYITRGAASKISKKLIAKKLIASYQLPSNKKEIYFQLTDQGKSINKRHSDLHKQFLTEDKSVFDQLSSEELTTLEKFLSSYNQHLDRIIRENLKN